MNITVDRAVIEQALDELRRGRVACEWAGNQTDVDKIVKAMDALRTALEQPEQDNGGKTGWPPGLLQDDCRGLSKWLASKPDAKRRVREALEQPEQKPVWWMLKTGHGTQFKEQLNDELRALTWKGKPMWTPLYDAPPQRKPLTETDIANACLSYRHDFGLMSDGDRQRLMFAAREWARAFGIKGEA